MSISSLAAVQVHAAAQPARSQPLRPQETDAAAAFRASEQQQASAVSEARRSVNILV